MIFIWVAVCYLLYKIIIDFNSISNPTAMKFNHHSILEIIWTILPAFLLVLIAVPSFSLLYSLDDLIDPALTVKIVGHQWYWSYEFSDHQILQGKSILNFDSYLRSDEESNKDFGVGLLRLLETDYRLLLPIHTHIRLLITSADVLHSWAIPSFGIKVDACPGRLSQASLFIKRSGVFYGQCSEICGVNHGFMPIVVKGVTASRFSEWLTTMLSKW